MAILVAVIVVIVIAAIDFACDYITYWRRLSAFELRAEEFVKMYNALLPKVLNKNQSDMAETVYVGDFFRAAVRPRDFKSFYLQMQFASLEVLEAYDRIGEEYLSEMDDETFEHIDRIYQSVQNIYDEINYQSWLLEFRKI